MQEAVGREYQLTRFSALQRAENSSMKYDRYAVFVRSFVSVLFSEPKIPQCSEQRVFSIRRGVSVLFSEPKIPQSAEGRRQRQRGDDVSVLFSEPKIPQ